MSRHVDNEELQDFLEGLLPPAEEERVRGHLDECSGCRGELEALSSVLGGLSELPKEAEPSRDLWPQISWRIEKGRHPAKEADRELVAAPSIDGAEAGGRGFGRVSIPAWQLLAASITIALISGGSVWAILAGRSAGTDVQPVSFATAAHLADLGEAYGGYDDAITDLEAVLERGRSVLDPETIQILETNLETIDRAIQEAGEALEQDPASTVLQRILAGNLRRKVDLLRQAASAVYANT
jgi:hypothetical protein